MDLEKKLFKSLLYTGGVFVYKETVSSCCHVCSSLKGEIKETASNSAAVLIERGQWDMQPGSAMSEATSWPDPAEQRTTKMVSYTSSATYTSLICYLVFLFCSSFFLQ